MRIAIVTDYYYPALGGITEHVHGQAMSLSRRGHEVTVITGNVFRAPQVVDSAFEPQKDVPFEIIRMGGSFWFWGNASQTLNTFHPLMYWKLKKLFRERRFDVIHTHAPYNPSIVQVVPFAAPKSSLTVGTFHSVFARSRLLDLTAPILRQSVKRLDGKIAVSDACIPSLEPYFPYEYTVIPNGVDETHFTPEAEPFERFRDGKKNILFLGRFDPRNGLDTMIKAFARIHRTRDDVRLIIVGDGPLRSYYERKVSPATAPAIVWAGRVNWDRPRYFTSADILCTPCDRASFGMVLLEAMSCGVPVVASKISGFQLLMQDGCQGRLIPGARDDAAFAEALTELLDDPSARERMGRAGRATAVEHYSWTSVAARLERYYLDMIASRQ